MAPENQTEIKVCRVCLALDVKMYDMKNFKLNEMFTKVTGIAVIEKMQSTLHRVCWECAARLTAASAFRDKALLSDALLKGLLHINKREIEQLKEYYSQLKPTLTIQTVYPSVGIEGKKRVYKRNSKRKTNIEEEERTVFDTEEPLIGIPIKAEIEFDPIAENFVDSCTTQDEVIQDRLRNTEEEIDNNDNKEDNATINVQIKEEIDIVNEYEEQQKMLDAIDNILDETTREDSVINDKLNDNDILLEESAKKRAKLDEVENIFDDTSNLDIEMNIESNDDSDIGLAADNVEDDPTLDNIAESSSEEDTQSLAELASVKKAKKQTKGKVGASNKGPNRLNDADKQKIIALKEKGMSMTEIADATGKTESCITAWWQRYSQEDSDNQEDSKEGNGTKQNDTGGYSNLVDFYPLHVIQKLTEVGFEHLLKKNLDDKNIGQKKSKFGPKSDNLKRQIVALKEAGLTTLHTAKLLGTTRNSVRLWWDRWCNERILTERKRKPRQKKTTAVEDQLIVERVAQSKSVHIPSLAKEFGISDYAVRRRLKEAGFKRQFIGPYIPLNQGRIKKVDEDLKQKILTMRQNGVSVTEIAMKCRVPRTTIYQWWRRWCKENNVESSNNTTDSTEEGPSITEDAKNEKTEQTPKKLQTKKALYSKAEETEKSKNQSDKELKS